MDEIWLDFKSRLSSILPPQREGEIDPSLATEEQRALWTKLQEIAENIKKDTIHFLNLPEDVYGDSFYLLNTRNEIFNRSKKLQDLANKIIELLPQGGIGPNYAYIIFSVGNNLFLLFTTTASYPDAYRKFREIADQCRDTIQKINVLFFPEIQRAEFEDAEIKINEITKTVMNHYPSEITKYIIVEIRPETVYLYCASQIMGRVIGNQGKNVKELQEKLKQFGIQKVKVKEDYQLSRLYSDQEIPHMDSEALQLVAQIMDLLEKLKKKGLSIDDVVKLVKHIYMKQQQEEPPSEEDYQDSGVMR